MSSRVSRGSSKISPIKKCREDGNCDKDNIINDVEERELCDFFENYEKKTLNESEEPTEKIAPLSKEETESSVKTELTAAEKARSERNRQKALLLRQARLSNQQIHGNVKKNASCSRYICLVRIVFVGFEIVNEDGCKL